MKLAGFHWLTWVKYNFGEDYPIALEGEGNSNETANSSVEWDNNPGGLSRRDIERMYVVNWRGVVVKELSTDAELN